MSSSSLLHSPRPLFSALKTLSHRHFSASLPRILATDRDNATPGKSPSFIHPAAIVHPGAVIGQGVSIGPFCTVGSSAKLGNACQLYPGSHIFGNTELGDQCILMTGAVVGDDLPGRTVIGCNNVIGHHCVVGIKCQDMKYKSGDDCFLGIGDNNEIREHTSIHRSSKPSEKTVIGDNNLVMGSCHIAHDCKVGSNNILANNTLLAGHVVVGDYAHTAGATVVHQFCHIGSFSFIGGGSVVSQDVPKYTLVSGERADLRGLNLEDLRRRGFSDSEIRSLRIAYRKIFMPTDVNSGGIENRLTEVVFCLSGSLLLSLSLTLNQIHRSYSILTFCKSRMKNLHMFLLCVQWFSPFAILLLKIVVEFASFNLRVVLRMHATVALL